jgi:hypothetical protein
MLQEIRVEHAIDLDTTSSFERGFALQAKAKKAVDFLLVGSSNAKNTMEALSRMGYSSWTGLLCKLESIPRQL